MGRAKAGPLSVWFEPNLEIRIAPRKRGHGFHYMVTYEGSPLEHGEAKTRQEAEMALAKSLDELSMDATSKERILYWLDLDAQSKIVKGHSEPASRLRVFVGS